MKHHLDFEKPIAELQTKLEELKKHPETHSIDISFEEEVASPGVRLKRSYRLETRVFILEAPAQGLDVG